DDNQAFDRGRCKLHRYIIAYRPQVLLYCHHMTVYNLRRNFILAILFIAVLGILDASYLTYEHYSKSIPPCSTSIWVDCGKVLSSKYSMVGPFPLSLLGLVFYSSMFGLAAVRLVVEKEMTVKDMLWRMVEKYARPRALT